MDSLYNWVKGRFDLVQQKNGSNKNVIQYSDTDAITMEGAQQNASDMFYPGGESDFAGQVLGIRLEVCDTTQKVIVKQFSWQWNIE